jgi:hypothetical protein
MNKYAWFEINPFIRQFHHLFPNSSTKQLIHYNNYNNKTN